MRVIYRLAHDIWTENRGFDRFLYLLRGVAWQVRKRLGHSFVTRLPSGALLKVEPSSSYSPIFYARWPDRKDILFIRNNSHLAPVFVDVGANVGLFSALLLDLFERYYLFEPAKSAFRALQDTAQLNPNTKWHLYNLALSDASGAISFLDEGNYSTTSRVADLDVGLPLVDIDATTLDDALNEESSPIVLKIDVEGHELNVFSGSSRLFSERQIRLVMFERLGRSNLNLITQFFDSHNYRMFYVTDHGDISVAAADISRPLVNLFACPAECTPHLRVAPL